MYLAASKAMKHQGLRQPCTKKLCDRFLGSSRSAQAKKPRIPLIVDDLLMGKAFDVMRGSVPASDAAGIVDAADLLPCCLFLEPIGPTQAC